MTFYDGVLDKFAVSRAEDEHMVVAARLKMGWITEEDLVGEDEEAAAEGSEETAGV